jgi:hypothetical protein
MLHFLYLNKGTTRRSFMTDPVNAMSIRTPLESLIIWGLFSFIPLNSTFSDS